MANYIPADAVTLQFLGSLAEAVVGTLVGLVTRNLESGDTEVVIQHDILNPATQALSATISGWNPVAQGDDIIEDVIVPTAPLVLEPGQTQRVSFTVKLKNLEGAAKSVALRIEANADAVTA